MALTAMHGQYTHRYSSRVFMPTGLLQIWSIAACMECFLKAPSFINYLCPKSDLWLGFAEYYFKKNSSHFAWEKAITR